MTKGSLESDFEVVAFNLDASTSDKPEIGQAKTVHG